MTDFFFPYCRMALTWNEVELTITVYNPSLRLRFFCFLSRSSPKAKEWKLIQLTWQLLRFTLFSRSKRLTFPHSQYLAVLLFCSATEIRADSKALVRFCHPGPKPFKVDRQPFVLQSGHTSQRLTNSSYQHHVDIFVAVVIQMARCMTSYDNILIYNTSNIMATEVS